VVRLANVLAMALGECGHWKLTGLNFISPRGRLHLDPRRVAVMNGLLFVSAFNRLPVLGACDLSKVLTEWDASTGAAG